MRDICLSQPDETRALVDGRWQLLPDDVKVFWKGNDLLLSAEHTRIECIGFRWYTGFCADARFFGDAWERGYHGAPVTAILEAYNMCQLQPDPGFADDNNYLKNTVAEEAHLDFFGELPEEKAILADGTDVTETVKKAESWLIDHSF